MKIPKINKYIITVSWILFFLLIFGVGVLGGIIFSKPLRDNISSWKNKESNANIAFLFEIYDKIKENYWEKITDSELSNLFKLGTEKLITSKYPLNVIEKKDIKEMLLTVMKNKNDKQKKEFSVNLANLVLANLKPFGRSGLYSRKDEVNLSNRVQNIDKTIDLYKVLGIDKNSSSDKIKQVYENKVQELTMIVNDNNKTHEVKNKAKEDIKLLSRAYETLSIPQKKQSYDKSGIEATTSYKVIPLDIFYIHIKQFSPSTFNELQQALEFTKNKDYLNYLILDLRGNVGGSIDNLQYFLGPFIGINQSAYEFFHQGNYSSFRTQVDIIPQLSKFQKIIVLIDGQVQSTGEVMAAVFKKYRIGVVVGAPTKGWGTVERVFNLNSQIDKGEIYSMFLVHSLTINDDGQPIEGKGVNPNININDTQWENELFKQINSPYLIQTVKNLLKNS